MAGHSKWANIKFRKAAQDAKKGKLFTKLIREITVAARQGGADASSNPRLRSAMDKAFSHNMTKDAIDRAIKRGIGNDTDKNFEEIRYEGYGPGGVAVMVDCLTDNKNRTVSEVRHAFSQCGGNLGTDGSVSYLFNKIGQIILTCDQEIKEIINIDKIMEIAIDSGANEVDLDNQGNIEIETPPEFYLKVKEKLTASGYQPSFADINMVPTNEINLNSENSEKVLKLINKLEDLDDVQSVYTNAIINDDIIKKMEF